MKKPKENTAAQKCLLTFGSWDSKGISFDINVWRDIIYIKSSIQAFSYLVNLKLKVEFKKMEHLYTGVAIDGNLYNANHKDLCKFKQLICARVTFLDIQNEYYINKKIGQGVEAEGVYEAQQIESQEFRSLKKYDKSQQSVKSIHKEVQISQKFSYKNVVKIFEVYESNSSIYIIYERLKVFETDKYTPQQKYNFIYDILNVIQLMHGKEYMHRDIKISNIMIGIDNEIKLVNFGLATKCKKQHKQCGTPGYMAPEIFTTRKYDKKCDVYSLGIMIYEMLTNDVVSDNIRHQNQIGLFNTDNLMKLPFEFQELTKFMLISDPNLRVSARLVKNFSIFNKDFDNSVLTDISIINTNQYFT